MGEPTQYQQHKYIHVVTIYMCVYIANHRSRTRRSILETIAAWSSGYLRLIPGELAINAISPPPPETSPLPGLDCRCRLRGLKHGRRNNQEIPDFLQLHMFPQHEGTRAGPPSRPMAISETTQEPAPNRTRIPLRSHCGSSSGYLGSVPGASGGL